MAKISKKRFLESLPETDGDIERLAELYGKTEATIYNWLKKYDPEHIELNRARQAQLERVIDECGGNLRAVARKLDITRPTVVRRVRDGGLEKHVANARENLREAAYENIAEAVMEKNDLDLSKFVLTHMPGGQRWSSKQEISVGAVPVSDEVLAMLDGLGVDLDTVAQQFEDMVRAAHVEAMSNG